MTISKTENQELHQVLFDMSNYYKWAPDFYEGFVKPYAENDGTLAGVMTAGKVRIDNDYREDFIHWLKEKGGNIPPRHT